MLWLLGGAEVASVFISHRYLGFDNNATIDIYIKTTLDSVFSVLSVATYSYTLHLYVASYRRRSTMSRQLSQEKITRFHLLRRSRFILVLVTVSTFFFFIVIPDVVILVRKLTESRVPLTILLSNYLLGVLADIVHCFVYIFCRAEVRKQMKKTVSHYVDIVGTFFCRPEENISFDLELRRGDGDWGKKFSGRNTSNEL